MSNLWLQIKDSAENIEEFYGTGQEGDKDEHMTEIEIRQNLEAFFGSLVSMPDGGGCVQLGHLVVSLQSLLQLTEDKTQEVLELLGGEPSTTIYQETFVEKLLGWWVLLGKGPEEGEDSKCDQRRLTSPKYGRRSEDLYHRLSDERAKCMQLQEEQTEFEDQLRAAAFKEELLKKEAEQRTSEYERETVRCRDLEEQLQSMVLSEKRSKIELELKAAEKRKEMARCQELEEQLESEKISRREAEERILEELRVVARCQELEKRSLAMEQECAELARQLLEVRKQNSTREAESEDKNTKSKLQDSERLLSELEQLLEEEKSLNAKLKLNLNHSSKASLKSSNSIECKPFEKQKSVGTFKISTKPTERMEEIDKKDEFENSHIAHESHLMNTKISERSLFEELQIKPAMMKSKITSGSEQLFMANQSFNQGSWEGKIVLADNGINQLEEVQEISSGVQADNNVVTEGSFQPLKTSRTLMKMVLLLLIFFLLFTFCGAVEINHELLYPCTSVFLTWGLGLSLPQPVVFLSYDGSLL